MRAGDRLAGFNCRRIIDLNVRRHGEDMGRGVGGLLPSRSLHSSLPMAYGKEEPVFNAISRPCLARTLREWLAGDFTSAPGTLTRPSFPQDGKPGDMRARLARPKTISYCLESA